MAGSTNAAKFKLPVFSISGHALFYVANVFIPMIVYDLCLLSAQFCRAITNIRYLENHMEISNRYTPRKIIIDTENLVFQGLQCQCLPQIPRRESSKLYNWVFCGELI
jgi:hypothetical protein